MNMFYLLQKTYWVRHFFFTIFEIKNLSHLSMEKIIRYIFAAICLTGCLFQIYRISAIYFLFETSTDVRFDNEVIISLPAITICASKHYFVREEILKNIFNNGSNEKLNDRTKILNYLNNLSIKDQFKSLQSVREILNKRCFVMKTNGFNSTEDFVECDKISPLRMSIDIYDTCFIIASQLNGESDDKYLINHDMSVDGYLTTLVKINFPKHVAESHVYMHSRSETIYEIHSRRGISSINHKQPENIKINYKKTLIKLIQKPYSTACVNYKQFGYNFRSDCIFKCKTDFHKKELNSWPGFYATNDSESDLFMTERENKSFNLIAGQKCLKHCGNENDCLKEYYVQDYRRFLKDNISFDIDVAPTQYPILIIKHSPKIQFEEFMCYIASITSVWFGFSVIMLSDICSLILKKFVLIIKNETNVNTVKINNPIFVSQRSRHFQNRMSNTALHRMTTS